MGLPLLRDAGVLDAVLVLLGGLGLLVSLAALLAVVLRARVTLRLGGIAAALGISCAVCGGAGVLHQRISTDAAVHAQRPVERQRQRRDGYLAARAPGRLGLLGAVVPLLAGVAAMFIGARRRAILEGPPPDPEFPIPLRPRLRLPVAVTGLGILASGFAVAALNEPVPGRNLGAGVTARRLLDHLEDIRRAPDGDGVREACAGLEKEMVRRSDTLDRGLVPGLPAAARRCVEARIQQAALRSPIGVVRGDLETIAASILVDRDPELQLLVASTVAEVQRIAAAEVEDAAEPVR